jgi:hypothetical protein
MTGAPYTGGSGTTTYPLLYLNDGTAPTTWRTAGTEIGINAPSGYTGAFIDFRLNGGATLFNVDNVGDIFANGNVSSQGGFYGTYGSPLYLQLPNAGNITTAALINGLGLPPTASVTGSGCSLGTLTGGDEAGKIAVAGGGTCTVTLTWNSNFAYTNGANCGPLRDVTSGNYVQDTGAQTATATTFPALAMSTSDVLRYGPCIGY